MVDGGSKICDLIPLTAIQNRIPTLSSSFSLPFRARAKEKEREWWAAGVDRLVWNRTLFPWNQSWCEDKISPEKITAGLDWLVLFFLTARLFFSSPITSQCQSWRSNLTTGYNCPTARHDVLHLQNLLSSTFLHSLFLFVIIWCSCGRKRMTLRS